MLKALKRAACAAPVGGSHRSKLESLRAAEAEADEETGHWHYLIVDPRGIRPREGASYSDSAKRVELERLKDGAVVEVGTRRRAGWTRWLCLSSGGWVFDVSPKDKQVRMVEVEVVRGEWQFQVGSRPLQVLPKPSLGLAAKLGSRNVTGAKVLEPEEVVVVKERIRPLTGKGSFLRLADGRGFVLDFSKGQQVMHRWQPAGGRCSDSGEASGTDADTMSPASAPSSLFDGDLHLHPLVPAPIQLDQAGGRAESTSSLGPAEFGSWDYVVLDTAGITLRSGPTYSKSAKLPNRLAEGETVKVVERRAAVEGGTTFLRLEHPAGSWTFDVQPGAVKSRRQRLAEVKIEYGEWCYQVVAPRGIAYRDRCSFSEASKIGAGPKEGALLTVSKRVRIAGTTFLKAREDDFPSAAAVGASSGSTSTSSGSGAAASAPSGGWIFDRRDGRRLVEGPLDIENLGPSEAFASVRAADGAVLLAAPTASRWARTSARLLPGARARVVRRCRAEGEEWFHVSRPGGMAGWSLAFNFELEASSCAASSSAGARERCGAGGDSRSATATTTTSGSDGDSSSGATATAPAVDVELLRRVLQPELEAAAAARSPPASSSSSSSSSSGSSAVGAGAGAGARAGASDASTASSNAGQDDDSDAPAPPGARPLKAFAPEPPSLDDIAAPVAAEPVAAEPIAV